MSRVVAGTLLLPNGQPMANASIYFTAKRTEPVSIIEGSNTFFNTNSAGVYNQTVVNGFYAVSIEYIADASGAYTRRWQLGDVFVETGATTTLEALIIASNVPSDLPLSLFYQILADAQQAAADAQAAAIAAAASAASIAIGTGPTNIPNTTILNSRLGTAGNLGNAAQAATSISSTDTTLGRVPVFRAEGFFGIGNVGGAQNLPASGAGSGDDQSIPTGRYICLASSFSSPPFGVADVYLDVHRGGSTQAVQVAHIFGSIPKVASRNYSSGAWSSWVQQWNTGNTSANVQSLLMSANNAEIRSTINASLLPAYTLGTVPAVNFFTNLLIIITDLVGGREPCFSDGTNWRRVSDRSIAS